MSLTAPSVLRRHPLLLILSDLLGLLMIQGLLLALTFLISRSDVGDLRVQVAWLVFLLPGWCLSLWWTRRHASLAVRYSHAVIGAIGIHACLLGMGSILRVGFQGYYVALVLVLVVLICWWLTQLVRTSRMQSLSMGLSELLIWVAVMILLVAVYRQPRSADIIQFLLQQQDMTAQHSLQASEIGMASMGVNEAMPRWRSHLWHLVPSVIADVTALPVDRVLRRWAPIPIAFSVLAVLVTVVQRLAGRRVPFWAVVLALFGPAILWYRSYNAFNYSFRLTNNFCLDKDLCLFLLIPAVVYLAIRWIRGNDRCLLPMLLLIPAIIKFHPMTAVYLVLLIPFVWIGYDRKRSMNVPTSGGRNGWFLRGPFHGTLIPSHRTIVWSVLCIILFLVVLRIGDAQIAHEQISEIARMDWLDHQSGRPLHYWVGHYADIEHHDLRLDTSQWIDGTLTLRSRVLWNCGLLAAMHGALLIWLFAAACRFTSGAENSRVLAFVTVMFMLWGMWWIAPRFLTWKPHYLAGYERLHWFAYVPALISVSGAFGIALRMFSLPVVAVTKSNASRTIVRLQSICVVAVVALLLYSAAEFRLHRSTIWTAIRGLNSLLDFELPDQIRREESYEPSSAIGDLLSSRPDYLNDTDRVLFLDNRGNDQYWLIKRGIFWSEPYAEAYAWHQRGDEFLEDRHYFYDLLDRWPVRNLASWLNKKGVTLIVDRRPGADTYLRELDEHNDLGLQQVKAGVWRRDLPSE